MDMMIPFDKKPISVPAAGDWRCLECGDLQFAKNPSCRKCGGARPQTSELQASLAAVTETQLVALTPAMSPLIAQMNQGEDWSCPLCKEVTFSTRTTCRRCGCPRPEGAMVVQTKEHQLSNGGYIGYLPNPNLIEATSSWSKQWDGNLCTGVMSLSACGGMMGGSQPYNPRSSSSSSTSSDDSGSTASDSESGSTPKKKKRKTEDKQTKTKEASESSASESAAGAKVKKTTKIAKEKKDGKDGDKVKDKALTTDETPKEVKKDAVGKLDKKDDKAVAKAKLDKKRKKAMDVEEELEKRRVQRERRKSRIVALT